MPDMNAEPKNNLRTNNFAKIKSIGSRSTKKKWRENVLNRRELLRSDDENLILISFNELH